MKQWEPVLLVVNPSAGEDLDFSQQLDQIVDSLLTFHFKPDIFIVEPGCVLKAAIQKSLRAGVEKVIVCGGDGTINSVARLIANTPQALGIIPMGTRNNIAKSLNIPLDIAAASEVIGQQNIFPVDMGLAECDHQSLTFLELCSIGLVSDLFPSADDIQHGQWNKIGEFVATLVGTLPAVYQLKMDDKLYTDAKGYTLLISNTPIVGGNYRVNDEASLQDGLLDIIFFAELSKLELMSYIFQGGDTPLTADPNLQHFKIKTATIKSSPPAQVMVDGIPLGIGDVTVSVLRNALKVITPG